MNEDEWNARKIVRKKKKRKIMKTIKEKKKKKTWKYENKILKDKEKIKRIRSFIFIL